MSLQIDCDRCGEEVSFPGGLVFSPPVGHSVEKYHICRACWHKFRSWLGVAAAAVSGPKNEED